MAPPCGIRHRSPDSALHVDHVVLGGGNARKLGRLPPKCRFGDNANAFLGGLRMWEKEIGSNQVDRSRKLVEKIRVSVAASPQ